jgi:hypothetical protein
VWLGSYAPSHLISSYIYVAYCNEPSIPTT